MIEVILIILFCLWGFYLRHQTRRYIASTHVAYLEMHRKLHKLENRLLTNQHNIMRNIERLEDHTDLQRAETIRKLDMAAKELFEHQQRNMRH